MFSIRVLQAVSSTSADTPTTGAPDVSDPSFWAQLSEQIVSFFTKDGPLLFLRIVFAILVLILGVYIIKILSHFLRRWLNRVRTKTVKGKPVVKKMDASVTTFIVTSLKFFLAIVLAFLVIFILGIPLTGFATIVSSAFLAIGLGLQDVITNFANGIILLSESNVRTGDYISVDGVEGTITKISIMRTSLSTTDGKTILIPNTKLSADIVTNYSDEKYRRIALYFTFRSGIDVDKMCLFLEDVARHVPKVDEKENKVKTIIDDFSQTRPNTIRIRVTMYVKNADYWDVLSEAQRTFYKRFQEEKIELADYDKSVYVPTGRN